MKNPTSEQLRKLKRDNLAQPLVLAPVPFEQWPPLQGDMLIRAPRLDVFRSRTFLVQIFGEPDGITRLSINRTEWDERAKSFRAGITWDDIQRLKAEAGYGDKCAVEIYPPADDVVNVANMRHVFILPAPPPYMWTRDQ